MLRLILISSLLWPLACRSDKLSDQDEVFFQWDDNVTCAASIDNKQPTRADNVHEAMTRVLEEDSVLMLYGHIPRGDGPLSVADLDAVLATVRDAGVPFVRFRELLDGPPRPGVSLSFDDAFIDEWYAERDTFLSYGARVTFFVTRFHRLSEDSLDKLRQLERDGHEIASHGLMHLDAAEYVRQYGVSQYIADEVVPSLDAMRAAGFDPVSFAYPYGSRVAVIDDAVLEHVSIVRSTSSVSASRLVSDPCPE